MITRAGWDKLRVNDGTCRYIHIRTGYQPLYSRLSSHCMCVCVCVYMCVVSGCYNVGLTPVLSHNLSVLNAPIENSSPVKI